MNSTSGGGSATMPSIVCEACGASNPADTTFCQQCNAFVGWDRTEMVPKIVPSTRPTASANRLDPVRNVKASDATAYEASIETRLIPTIPSEVHPSERVPVLAVRVEQDRVTVPLSGEPAELALVVVNRSNIVDGYEVDVSGAPGWLRIESSMVRLLPGSEEQLVVSFRIESDALIPAGENSVRLRVRSLAQPNAYEVISVTVAVPMVDALVQLRTEPSVVRIRDVEVGRFVVVVDNSGANRPARVRLSGTDPELAVSFHFDPEVATVGPGESVRVRAVTTSHRPQPGTEQSRTLTVSATEGTRRVSTTATLVQSTSAVIEDPMVDLVIAPALVRVRDDETARVRMTIDNRAGRRGTAVRLAASDPEGVVWSRWSSTEVQVPAGGTVEVELQLAGPAPEAGTETTRTVTLAASDGRRVARTQVSMVHGASASPMTTLAVQLDPSVVRLGTSRRGTTAVVVDNRRGVTPARVWLQGDDPENTVSFGFSPSELVVGPGQLLTSRVSLSAPRPPAGREVSRPLTISATDGRTSVTTDGTIIQSTGDRRPWARVLLTLAGGLTMVMGAMMPLIARSSLSPFGVNVDTVARLFNTRVDLGGLEQLINFGIVIMALAGLMVFGLTGRSGRLTRYSAVLAVLLTVALLITLILRGVTVTPGSGTILIVLGAVLGYIGGLLARR